MRVLLTGSTGFIGTALLRRLRSQGVEVIAVGRVQDDISLFEALHLKDVKIDGCFHLATLYVPNHRESDIPSLVNANVMFGTRVLEVARMSGCKWFINASSFWQHASDGRPVNLYSALKEAFQGIAGYYHVAYGMKVSNLELTDTYGSEDRRKKLINLWCEKLNGDEQISMSCGKQEIELVHKDDVVDAFMMLMSLLHSNYGIVAGAGETYFLPVKEKVTVREAAAVFECATGGKLPIQWGARPERPREIMQIEHRGTPLPGWRQKIGLSDGFARLYADFKNG